MKNLILCAIASLFLFTSCFENNDEVTIAPKQPIEGEIMDCKQVKDFINEINSYPIPREGDERASIQKYNFRGKITYFLNPTSSYLLHAPDKVINSQCEDICFFSMINEENTCLDWNENAVYIKTIWQDNR